MSSGTAAKHIATVRIINHSLLPYWKISPSSRDMHNICLPAMHALNLHLDCKEKYCRYCFTLLRFADAFTQPTMLTLLFPLQRVTATSMPVAVDSTWSCTSCRGGRAEGSAWTAATTLQAATATTARRAFTETWPGRSLTDEPAKVNKKVLLLSARLNSASLFLIVEILEMLYVLIAVCVFYTSLGNKQHFLLIRYFWVVLSLSPYMVGDPLLIHQCPVLLLLSET